MIRVILPFTFYAWERLIVPDIKITKSGCWI